MQQLLQPKQMHWVRADSSDFGGEPPAPRRLSSPSSPPAVLIFIKSHPTRPPNSNQTVVLRSRSCSGHTAVSIGKSKVVVFGGFADKRFLSDVSVYDVGNQAPL
jgi:hypothetical protein